MTNVLQGNLRTGRVKECIFKASGGTKLKFFLSKSEMSPSTTSICSPPSNIGISITYNDLIIHPPQIYVYHH